MSKLAQILRSLDVVEGIREIISEKMVESVQRLCWHCCHTWSGPTIPFPMRHDERRNKFTVVGQFCSWECVKAYNRDQYAGIRNSLNSVNIRHYYKKVTGDSRRFVSAPPRALLKAFGGTLTIDEFRRSRDPNLSYSFAPGRFVHVVPQSELAAPSRKKAPETAKPVDFGDAVCKNDNLRMKRPKPLTHGGRNGLERALGLNSLLKKPVI